MGDFRETLATVDARGRRRWVYASEVPGYFKRRRTAVAWMLLAVYLGLPWITVGGAQAVFLDLASRRFTFFGATLWATDTGFLALLLITLGLCLFLFTALLGRVWCGWACPQTVFLEFVFRPIERMIEGSPQRRRALDQASWDLRKIRVKLTKYLLFAAIAWLMASTFLAYFVGREPLIAMMCDYPWHNLQTFCLTLVMMAVLLFEFGWFREQFCTVLCPYARFQSVLLDDTSLVVSYDARRGEPRGKVQRAVSEQELPLGDCVDCSLCVRVCPTGIDIRNGLQLECVQCAACVDACDSIMSKVGRPSGLIRYATERGLRGEPVRALRPRVLGYAVALLAVLGAWGWALTSRTMSEASLLHSANDALFEVRDDGMVVNHLELRLSNKSRELRRYSVAAATPSVSLTVPLNPFPLGPESTTKVPVFAVFPRDTLVGGRRRIGVTVADSSGESMELSIELHGPG